MRGVPGRRDAGRRSESGAIRQHPQSLERARCEVLLTKLKVGLACEKPYTVPEQDFVQTPAGILSRLGQDMRLADRFTRALPRPRVARDCGVESADGSRCFNHV